MRWKLQIEHLPAFGSSSRYNIRCPFDDFPKAFYYRKAIDYRQALDYFCQTIYYFGQAFKLGSCPRR
jgi:hypothetical protein